MAMQNISPFIAASDTLEGNSFSSYLSDLVFLYR